MLFKKLLKYLYVKKMLLGWQNPEKYCIFVKTPFHIPSFVIKKVLEETANFDFYKYGL